MDKDGVDGVGKRLSGSVKEGIAQKAAGAAQNAVGGVKDGVRDTVKN